MSDTTLRALERQGEASFAHRLRAGQISPDLVRLLALCEVPGAQEAAPCYAYGFDSWRQALRELTALQPQYETRVDCDGCDSTGTVEFEQDPVGPWDDHDGWAVTSACPDCSGRGGLHVVTASARLLSAAALSVADRCWISAAKLSRMGMSLAGCTVAQLAEAKIAIESGKRWVGDPIQPRLEDWVALTEDLELPPWCPRPQVEGSLVYSLSSATGVLGSDRVRKLANAAVVEVLRERL